MKPGRLRPALSLARQGWLALPMLRTSGVGRRKRRRLGPDIRSTGETGSRAVAGLSREREQGFAWLQTPVLAPAAVGAGKSDRPEAARLHPTCCGI
ncbi:hypothetical protein NOVOSPHI9U_750004 [Novosphingobium sp. 9U]|nr:hypothetical protein NOVOSPHI9U_750004 [Novosphingobium sp. 9U]